MEQLLYGVDQAAKMLGLGRVKTYELIMSGQLVSHTVGRRRLISAEALRAYVKRLAVEQVPVEA